MAENSFQYYLDLITSEYQNSGNFLIWVSALLNKGFDISTLLDTLDTNFDIDNAVGSQLDMLGSIVGERRTVGFQPSNSLSPVLDDNTYRILLKAKIARNQWNGKIDGLQSIWATLFPAGKIIIIDNQNMTVNIAISGTFSSIVEDLIQNGYIVPRPQGVLVNYSFGTMPFFGFDRQDFYISGFDTGNWA